MKLCALASSYQSFGGTYPPPPSWYPEGEGSVYQQIREDLISELSDCMSNFRGLSSCSVTCLLLWNTKFRHHHNFIQVLRTAMLSVTPLVHLAERLKTESLSKLSNLPGQQTV
jgi:hypothetical protein